MSTELVELDAGVLRELLQKQDVSRFVLAEKLDISTKTIQRWLNQSVRRVKPETIQRLGSVLGVCPTQLRKDVPALSLRVTDKTVAEICTERVFERTRSHDTWSTYLEMLKSINADALSSEQRFSVYRNIGVSSFYLSKFKASEIYLRQALQIAQMLNDANLQMDALTWAARRAEAFGDFVLAESFLHQAEELIPLVTDSSIQAEFYYFRSRVELHRGQCEKALRDIRQSLVISYRRKSQPLPLLISLDYVHLIHIYVRMGHFKMAKTTAQKLARSAETSGWMRGSMLAQFYLGMLEHFMKGPSEISQRHFGKARLIRRSLWITRYCPLVTQAEFICLLLTGRYDEARTLFLHRLQRSRKSPLYFSLATLDGLLLSRLEGTNMRQSLVDKARQFFSEEQMLTAVAALEKTEGPSSIAPSEISKFFYI